ncbi:hypothetical protein cyc_04795 [Cyclospora cayetanensis]|uniref:Uncharacterized protein n=1 Tax=Cyclospora cayetanensis TaxID=88456 RepID=A0A1D3D5Q5_9EIME|nr:hypothetical protein cyc_04795 [Cyclospora cayetanensis]
MAAFTSLAGVACRSCDGFMCVCSTDTPTGAALFLWVHARLSFPPCFLLVESAAAAPSEAEQRRQQQQPLEKGCCVFTPAASSAP